MQRVEVDNDFNVHTSYHKDFFLLRTRVLVNGENTEITSVKEGSDEAPVMSFCHNSSTITTKLWAVVNSISPILHKCGIHHVNTFYYKQSLLFQVTFSSELQLKNFFLEIRDVQCTMEQELLSMISGIVSNHGIESPQSVAVEVQPDLFLVSPDLHNAKGAERYLVTAENYSSSVIHWKSSKLLDFESLFPAGKIFSFGFGNHFDSSPNTMKVHCDSMLAKSQASSAPNGQSSKVNSTLFSNFCKSSSYRLRTGVRWNPVRVVHCGEHVFWTS